MERYTKQEKAGQGTYGVVYKSLDKQDNTYVALKVPSTLRSMHTAVASTLSNGVCTTVTPLKVEEASALAICAIAADADCSHTAKQRSTS